MEGNQHTLIMLRLVKIDTSELNKLKQRVLKFLGWGTKDVQTAIEAGPYGFDSMPVKDMIAVYGRTEEVGKTVIIGYLNKNQLAQLGESRIYSTDDKGALKIDIWLKNDGTMELGGSEGNVARFQELKEGFDQLKDDHNKLVQAFNAHMHPTAATGPPSIATPIPNQIPAVPSNASIDDAKIDEIKTM